MEEINENNMRQIQEDIADEQGDIRLILDILPDSKKLDRLVKKLEREENRDLDIQLSKWEELKGNAENMLIKASDLLKESMKKRIDNSMGEYPDELVRMFKKTCNIEFRISKLEYFSKIIALDDEMLRVDEEVFHTPRSQPVNQDINLTLDVPIYNNKGKLLPITRTFEGLNRNDYNILSWMHNECHELSRYPLTGNCIALLHNYTQAGKTRSFIFRCLLSIVLDRNVYINVLNLKAQGIQLEDSLNAFYDELIQAGKEHGFNAPRMVPLASTASNKKTILAELKRGGAIVTGLDNVSQLTILLDCLATIQGNEWKPLDAIVDESDNPIKESDDNMVKRDELRDMVHGFVDVEILVTATPVAHYFKHGAELRKQHLICASVPGDYVGFRHPLHQVVEVAENVEGYKTMKEYTDGKFVPQPWFTKAIAMHLALEERTTGENHNLLVKITHKCSNMRSVREYLEKKHPNHPSLVENSKSLDFYMPGQTEPLNWFPNAGYSVEGCVHRWSTPSAIGYGDIKRRIMDLCAAMGNTNCYFEITGRQADRGLRFKTDDHRWMPSGMLYMESSSIDYATAYQSTGRIHGRRGFDENGELIDGDIKYLYTTAVIHRILNRGYENNERFSRDNDMAENATMEEVLRGVPLPEINAKTKMTRPFKVSVQLKKVTIEIVVDNEHSEDAQPNGEWRRIIRSGLTDRAQGMYDNFVAILADIDHAVYTKSDIIQRITRDTKNQKSLTDGSWHWTRNDRQDRYWKPALETDQGLIFHYEDNTWYIVYNA
jgi:hypothetical protein